MDPKLRMLVWQELRQRRTQMAVCMLWMVGTVVYCYAGVWWGASPLADGNHVGTDILYAMFVPIFLSMRTALGEVTDRTRSFIDALPISARWRATVRLVGGAGV